MRAKGRDLQMCPSIRLMARRGDRVLRFGPVVDGQDTAGRNQFYSIRWRYSVVGGMFSSDRRLHATERTVYDIDDPSYGKLDEAGFWTGPKKMVGDEAQGIIDLYRKKYPKATPYELAIDIATDATSISSIRLAGAACSLGKAPTYDTYSHGRHR